MFQYHNSDYYDHHYEFEVIITKETTPATTSIGTVGIMYEALRLLQIQQENNTTGQGRVVEELEESHVAPSS
jgi:hypothetical protein